MISNFRHLCMFSKFNIKSIIIFTCFFVLQASIGITQNSMVGDGFGGRLWYNPSNYTVGSYSAYSICYDICGSGETQLYGWGANYSNQLGLGFTNPGTPTPTPIPNTNGVRYYSTGYIMGAIKNDNTGWAWGNAISGNPIQVITDAKFLDASAGTISFVKNNGTVWSIGSNYSGNFGDGTITFSPIIPVQMQNMNNAVRVANNGYATIILLNDSTLMSVGTDAGSGALGLGLSISSTYSPLPIPGLPKIVDIKSHAMGTIALTSDGEVYFWGINPSSWATFYTPTIVPNLNNIVAISGCDDGYHFMALDSNKNCYAWGDNSMGQCGVSNSLYPTINSPIIVETNVIDIMAGETFSYLVKANGTLWASGASNGYSIWLNLSDFQRNQFTQLDPSQLPGACELVGINASTTSCTDSIGGSITITNYGGQSPYQYSIGSTFQSSNVFNDLSAGTYTITVQDANGCEYSSTAIVDGNNCQLSPPEEEGFITFPNVFSPNADSENENFYFPNEGLTEINCKIYDRWGLLIYEWNNVNGSWNGKNTNGKDCPEGTYYYIVSYKLFDGELKSNHGHVTLIK